MLQRSLACDGVANSKENVTVIKAVPSLPASFWCEVAALHRREIHGGFISSLNPKFLQSIYKSIARSDNAFLLAACETETERVHGFICGSTNTKSVLIQVLLRSGVGLIVSLLPNVFSLRTVRKLFETARYAGAGASEALPRAEILNFCVDRQVQRRGMGRLLFAALRAEFRQRGVQTIKIVTGESQIGAQRFYDAVNARRAGNLEIHDNSKSVVFLYDIS
ncbi:MAG: GNAT family N-acetyltransferase [Terracidiphilus sp.]